MVIRYGISVRPKRRDIGGDTMTPFQHEQLFSLNQATKKCRICENPDHFATCETSCSTRKSVHNISGRNSNANPTVESRDDYATSDVMSLFPHLCSYHNQSRCPLVLNLVLVLTTQDEIIYNARCCSYPP